MREIIELFLVFAWIGLFAFGGGLATIPLIKEQIVHRGWISLENFFNMVAISESTPGPIGINLATFVGFQKTGIIGAFTTSVAVVTPSFILIILFSKYLPKFSDYKGVKAAFFGIRSTVVGLVASAALAVLSISVFNLNLFMDTCNIYALINLKAVIIFALLFIIYYKLPDYPILIIGLGGLAGILFL